jgi:hypothetical protein
MVKQILIAGVLLFSTTCLAQSPQFSIVQLSSMISGVKIFESNMLKAGNTPKVKYVDTTYSAQYADGGISASDELPTNDSKYDNLWKWPDGRILSSTQIDNYKLDEDYKIRNNLVENEDQPINKREIQGYSFEKSKIIELVRHIRVKSKFYQDYNGKTLTGSYTYVSDNYKLLIGDKTHFKSSNSIEYEFFDEVVYKKFINQISSVANYIETKKDEFDNMVSYYKYGTILITTNIDNDDDGITYTISFTQ